MAEVKSRTTTKKAAPAAKKTAPAKSATKAVAKTAAAKPAASQKAVPAPAKNPSNPKVASAKKGVSAEQRYRMIAEAAYYIAEKRGFAPGDPARDWAEAEAQIRVMFSA